MRAVLPLALLLTVTAAAQSHTYKRRASDSAVFLFEQSNSSAALRQAATELRSRPNDVTALFVQMEAARLQLNSKLELHSALAILELAGDDPRADLAAERVRELAGNTSIFRAALPRIARVLSTHPNCSRILTEALLAAADDGVPVSPGTVLARRLQRWQIAGPFGKYSNVNFDQSWPPQRDGLRSSHYGSAFRENVASDEGILELPDYFPRQGVYYAASDFSVTWVGQYQFAIESDGTYDFQVDGRTVVHHDSRFHEVSTRVLATVSLTPGKHRVELKLHPSALPLRMWIESKRKPSANPFSISGREKEYVTAATSFLEGDSHPALSLGDRKMHVAIFKLLAAEALVPEDSQLAREAFNAALAADPQAALAEFQLAALDFDTDRFEDEAVHLHRVLKSAPQYWRAQELKYRLAAHFGWTREQKDALTQRLRLHPDCGALLDAARFYSDQDELGIALKYEQRLSTCSTRPNDYWERLSQSGRHADALASLRSFLVAHPLDRRALERAVLEAVLAGNSAAALDYADRLRKAAPNSTWAASLASNPRTVLDARSTAPDPGNFYRRYVRDGRKSMHAPADNSEDAELLLNDCVIKLDQGYAWVYRHIVTQVFDKRGIDEAGEIAVPRGAEILVVRTLKQNGTSIEPELSDNKNSISMSGLEIGDAIEISYLQHFTPETLETSPGNLDFVFSAADKLTASARLIVLRGAGQEPLTWHSPEVKQVRNIDGASGGSPDKITNRESVIETWEVSDVSAPPSEPDSARDERRPVMRWLAMNRAESLEVPFRLRDKLIDATKITQRIADIGSDIERFGCHQKETQHAASLPLVTPCSPTELIDAAYQRVAAISNEPQSWFAETITSADQTFQQESGNRAAALISLLSAMGFKADLAIAAELGAFDPKQGGADELRYIHPLVRVVVPGSPQTLLLDPQMEGLAPGALSPEVEGEPAMIISRLHPESQVEQVPRATDQRSVAKAELEMDSNSAIRGRIHVRFGSVRGAQLRETLRQVSDQDRQKYFEQIAGRILPGVREVSGRVLHEEDFVRALELDLEIKATGATNGNGSQFEMGQLLPALGLSRLYASLPTRWEDLLIETPLVEKAEFVIHLPPGIQISHLPDGIELKNQFGSYTASFAVANQSLTIVRDFNIPAQIVPSLEYSRFQKFAIEIDNFERQSIALERPAMAESATR